MATNHQSFYSSLKSQMRYAALQFLVLRILNSERTLALSEVVFFAYGAPFLNAGNPKRTRPKI